MNFGRVANRHETFGRYAVAKRQYAKNVYRCSLTINDPTLCFY